jgi:hypothetical protein
MENPVSGAARPPFNPSASEQSDIKQRFYRYFQEEVTGMNSLIRLQRKHLTLPRTSRSDEPARKLCFGWRRKTRCN